MTADSERFPVRIYVTVAVAALVWMLLLYWVTVWLHVEVPE